MRFSARYTVESDSSAADFLADRTGLSKGNIKECMSKGGVWLIRRGKEERCRKATAKLAAGDRISLYYDQEILQRIPPSPLLVADCWSYSVWDKPAGLLSQGTRYGDHCSMLRLAGHAFSPSRQTYLVHRLDREASGLIVIAHSAHAASALSRLWQSREVIKEYQIVVRGIWNRDENGTIADPLDGKEASTGYRVVFVDHKANTTTLRITLHTGRRHQIRRHFAQAGFPVLGDPAYGSGNKNTDGLALRAIRLSFLCPMAKHRRDFTLPPQHPAR